MEIFIDETRYEAPVRPEVRVMDVIEHVKQDLKDQKRIIVSIQCDSKPVEEGQIEQVLGQELGGLGRLDLKTVSVPDLANRVLEGAGELLRQTRPQQDKIVELLNKDELQEAIETLGLCIQAWAQAHDSMVKTIQLLELDLESLSYQGTPALTILNQVADQLSQIKECLQMKDYVLLNDLVQYEISPSFDQWEGLIQAVQKTVHPAGPSDRS